MILKVEKHVMKQLHNKREVEHYIRYKRINSKEDGSKLYLTDIKESTLNKGWT